jgi:hypothetical protein
MVLTTLSFFIPQVATAAGPLTALSDTMSRLQKSTVKSDHTIKFTTPTGVAAGQNIQITMPTGFAIGSVDYTDIDVSWGPSTGAENELTLAGTPSGATWGAAFAGQILSITSGSGTITGTSKVIVEIGLNATGGDQQITNHATAGTYTISIAGSFTDTGSIAIVILDSDQVSLTASVDPSISFSISATSSAFSALSVGSVTTSTPNITLTVGTNSLNGYTISVRDAGNASNPGLYNAAATYLIGSANAAYDDNDLLEIGQEGYGIQASSAGATIPARFDQSGNNVGGLELTATTLASYATKMTSNQTITITHKAAIAAFTSAGNYADTLTYIATGNF